MKFHYVVAKSQKPKAKHRLSGFCFDACRFIIRLPGRAMQSFIRVYQKTLSPDHGPFSHSMKYPTCRFHPTCSQYGYESIGKYGVIRGGAMAVWRILRCNPWSKGGYDPVP